MWIMRRIIEKLWRSLRAFFKAVRIYCERFLFQPYLFDMRPLSRTWKKAHLIKNCQKIDSPKQGQRAAAIAAALCESVPNMALILLVKVQSLVFTAKCSEPQIGASNGMDEGSYS